MLIVVTKISKKNQMTSHSMVGIEELKKSVMWVWKLYEGRWVDECCCGMEWSGVGEWRGWVTARSWVAWDVVVPS